MKITRIAQDLETFVEAILSQKIKLGEVLRQKELCQALDLSLTPLRELIVLLKELDLVETTPGASLKIIYPSIDFMRENMQFRIMMEMEAIEAFIDNVSDDWITDQILLHQRALHELETVEDLVDANTFIPEIDRNFHYAIVSSLKNRAITKAHEYTLTKLRIASKIHGRHPPRKFNVRAMQEHLTILEAMTSKDIIKVRAALDAHYTQSVRNLLAC